jgi:hypothetical protein
MKRQITKCPSFRPRQTKLLDTISPRGASQFSHSDLSLKREKARWQYKRIGEGFDNASAAKRV